jgi:hypothetical protein
MTTPFVHIKFGRIVVITMLLLLKINYCLPQDAPPAPPGHGENGNQAPGINENLLIEFLQVFGSENVCYSGYDVISASDVVVYPQGSLLLKAVDAIQILPPTHFYSGAFFRAVISTEPCDDPEQLNEFLLSDSNTSSGNEGIFRVYPNPGGGVFVVEPIGAGLVDAEIQVYSLSGGLLHQQRSGGNQSQIVDLSEKEKGVYLLRIINTKSTSTRKIVIR